MPEGRVSEAPIRAIGQREFSELGEEHGFFHKARWAINGDFRPQDHPDRATMGTNTKHLDGLDGKSPTLRPIIHASVVRLCLQAICREPGTEQVLIVPERPLWSTMEESRRKWYIDPAIIQEADPILAECFVGPMTIDIDAKGDIRAFLCTWRFLEGMLERLCCAAAMWGYLDAFFLVFPGLLAEFYITDNSLVLLCSDGRKTHIARDVVAVIYPGMKFVIGHGTLSREIDEDDR